MAHNEQLTIRVREALAHIKDLEEKRAFRGIIFMVNGKMCVSTGNDELMCRIDPALHDEVMERNGTREMNHSGKAIRGYIYVHEDNIKNKADFDYWIKLCLDWNKHAKASKKPAKGKSPKTSKVTKPAKQPTPAKKAKAAGPAKKIKAPAKKAK